jgi:hypothetical protein
MLEAELQHCQLPCALPWRPPGLQGIFVQVLLCLQAHPCRFTGQLTFSPLYREKAEIHEPMWPARGHSADTVCLCV